MDPLVCTENILGKHEPEMQLISVWIAVCSCEVTYSVDMNKQGMPQVGLSAKVSPNGLQYPKHFEYVNLKLK